MEKKIVVTEDYLCLPVCTGGEERKIEIFLKEEEPAAEKIYEFMIPVDGKETLPYACDFFAKLPVKGLKGRQILIKGDVPKAFADSVKNEKKREEAGQSRAAVHFAVDTGWTNDPNGLIYADGVYHLYFQYNPFHIIWNNMSWGHAVSTDLLHWKQEDPVMFPDESGAMYSGCALANDRGMLGLPKEAILFFYTAAGGTTDWSRGVEFTQKIAYSLDGGRTLVKRKEPCLPTVFRENRDPKVYWHEESQAYVMALWLKGNDYAIFRSEDLQRWEESDRFTLEDAWECPDFFRLTSDERESCWFFWTADGFYYPGQFDGYRFRMEGERHHAYVNRIPYAAQTYSGTEGRVISVPWLRIENDGRNFTGFYGIPVELSCTKSEEGFLLLQNPVRELMEQAKPLEGCPAPDPGGRITYKAGRARRALVADASLKEMQAGNFIWEINGSRAEYGPESGMFIVDGEKCQVGCGHREIRFVIDDRILEVFFDGGVRLGTFALREPDVCFTAVAGEAVYAVYEIE